METITNLIDDLNESIEQRIKVFEAKLEDETDKEKRKFIEGNIAGLRLSKILMPLKETIEIKAKTTEEYWKEVVENYLVNKRAYWIGTDSKIDSVSSLGSTSSPKLNMNAHLSEERAEAFIYLQALVTARDYYNEGWIADWKDATNKFIIRVHRNIIIKEDSIQWQFVLAFKSSETRDRFYDDFREWIEKTKDLI